MSELDTMKRWLTWTIYATPLMTLTTDLGLSIRVSMIEHVDWWLGPLPRSPGMGEGGDWRSCPMGVIAKGIPRGYQGLFTPVSLGYPLSVFNKNSTLKEKRSSRFCCYWCWTLFNYNRYFCIEAFLDLIQWLKVWFIDLYSYLIFWFSIISRLWVFPRKMANVLKMFVTNPIR